MNRMNNRQNIKSRIAGRMKGITYLFLSILIMIIFVFVLAPGIDNVQYVKPLIKFIDEHEINATALYYTDIDEFSVAEINLQNTLDYFPRFTSDKNTIKIPDSFKLKLIK